MSSSTVREHSGREYLHGMTADELFLLTFEDLEERVPLGAANTTHSCRHGCFESSFWTNSLSFIGQTALVASS
jgi:hypothetical protein